jgi:hypothetical protein
MIRQEHTVKKRSKIYETFHTDREHIKTQCNIQPTHARKLYKKGTFLVIWVPLVMFYAPLNLRSGFFASHIHLRRTFCASKSKKGSTSRICLAQVIPCAKSGALVDLRKSLPQTNPKNRIHSFGPVFDPKARPRYCTP